MNRLLLLLLIPLSIVLACSNAGPAQTAGDHADDPATGAPVDTGDDPNPIVTPGACADAPYEVAGPYVAGVATLDMSGVPVEVWYPADPGAEGALTPDVYDMRWWLPQDIADQIPADAPTRFQTAAYRDIQPSAAGPFPVVLFSHGMGGFRMQSTFLTQHLATWGFIVAAPDHAERGLATVLGGGAPQDLTVAQLRDTLALLKSDSVQAGALGDHMDFTRVAVTGHSMGGAGASIVAGDDDIHAWALMASAGFGAGADKPALLMGGAVDAIASPKLVTDSYAELDASTRRYVSIADAGHLAFTDICAIGRDQGGVLQIAIDAGVEIPALVAELATDGCGPEDLPAEDGWPIISHYMTAHLKASLSGGAGTGLDEAAAACFGDAVANWQADVAPAAVEPEPEAEPEPTDPGPTEPKPEPTEPDPEPEPEPTDPEPEPEPDPDPVEPEPPATDPNAGVVSCGDTTCQLDQAVCCVGLTGSKCAAACGLFEAPQKCDGPEDCADDQGCFAGFPTGAECKSQGAANDAELCHTDADCDGADTCNACTFPGSPPTNVCNQGC